MAQWHNGQSKPGHGSEMADMRKTQPERDFSCVGHTITDTRSRLSAEKVESVELIRWGLRAGLI